MTKLVILNFGTGNFQSGFPTITMQLGETGNLWMQVTGSLPAAPALLELYRSWQILYKAINYNSDRCTAVNSLSLLVALHYLQKAEGIEFDYTSTGELKIGGVVLRELDTYPSRDRSTDTRGRQILLNYRSLDSPLEIATTVTVGDIIENRISPTLVPQLKNRIVLIGIAAPFTTSNDYWLTPDSATQPIADSKVPGVFIQAHMVSQLISAVLDGRPLLWLLPWWGEFLWIWVWCSIASLINRLGLLRIEFTTLLILGFNLGVSYILLLRGVSMPLIPSTMAIALASFATKIYCRKAPE